MLQKRKSSKNQEIFLPFPQALQGFSVSGLYLKVAFLIFLKFEAKKKKSKSSFSKTLKLVGGSTFFFIDNPKTLLAYSHLGKVENYFQFFQKFCFCNMRPETLAIAGESQKGM